MSLAIRKTTVRNQEVWVFDRMENGRRKRSFFKTEDEAQAAADATPVEPYHRATPYSIRQGESRGVKQWILDRREQGKRKRSFFSSKAEAEAAADMFKSQGDDDQSAFLALEPAKRRAIMEACLAAMDGGRNLEEVVAAIKAQPAKLPDGKTCQEALNLYLAHLKAESRSDSYISSNSQFLKTLVKGREEKPLSSIDKDALVAWLEGRAGYTRSTLRARVRAFLTYAVREEWISSSPAERIPPVRIVSKTPAILTPAQHHACLRFLEAKYPRGLAWYILSAICGLRPYEAMRMTWANVILDTAEPVLRVQASTSKVGLRRVVELNAHATAWLRHAKALGSELPMAKQPKRRVQRRLREILGIDEWTQDITRHSAASYLMAIERNGPMVAEQLGHTVKVMNRHYRAVVTREEAEKYFAIDPAPAKAPNTVSVNFRGKRAASKPTPAVEPLEQASVGA